MKLDLRRRFFAVPPAAIVLALLCCAYFLLAVRPTSLAYLDYVDGYYLYTAHRMAQGAVLYSGLMGVQPPGIYLVGDILFRIHDALATVRLYAAFLHCAILVLVYGTARRLLLGTGAALIAAALYVLAPYSLLWSRIFDPNPLVTFLSLASLYLLLGATPRRAAGSGMLGGLALLTKVWYVPLGVLFVVFLARKRPDVLRYYLAGLIGVIVPACVLGTISAGSAFWQGLLVQDASSASASWLIASLYHVLADDWPLLLLGVAGARGLLRRRPVRSLSLHDPAALLYPGVYARSLTRDGDDALVGAACLTACLVIGATVKSGTAWPVFQFAEPFLAVAAATRLFRQASSRPHMGSATAEAPLMSQLPDGAYALDGPRYGTSAEAQLATVFGEVARATPPVGRSMPLLPVLAMLLVALWSLPALRSAGQWQDGAERRTLARLTHAGVPGMSTLGPPFYLYLANQRELGEFSDVNLWALRAARGDRDAVILARQTVALLRRRALPIVLADSRVHRLPGVSAALSSYYTLSPYQDPLPADRAVQLWLPRVR